MRAAVAHEGKAHLPFPPGKDRPVQVKQGRAVLDADAVDLRDLFALIGLASLGYGLHAIYPPAAWIVVGGMIYRIGTR